MAETLNRKEAESVVAYRQTIRTQLNELGAEAAVAHGGKFELKNGAASSATDLLSKISSLVPVFGQPASVIFSLVGFGVKQAEESSEKAVAEKILKVSCGDSTEWNSVTKDLSRKLGEERVGELKGLSKKDAEILAKSDLAKIVTKILAGDLPSIESKQELVDILKTAAIAPNTLMKQTSYRLAFSSHQLTH